jgi:hypothetical protein
MAWIWQILAFPTSPGRLRCVVVSRAGAQRILGFEFEGHRYRATAGFYPDNTSREIFLHARRQARNGAAIERLTPQQS